MAALRVVAVDRQHAQALEPEPRRRAAHAGAGEVVGLGQEDDLARHHDRDHHAVDEAQVVAGEDHPAGVRHVLQSPHRRSPHRLRKRLHEPVHHLVEDHPAIMPVAWSPVVHVGGPSHRVSRRRWRAPRPAAGEEVAQRPRPSRSRVPGGRGGRAATVSRPPEIGRGARVGMSYKGPSSLAGTGDAPDRPIVFSDPAGPVTRPARPAPSKLGRRSCGSSLLTDPALPGGSAWEKFYVLKALRHKGFREILRLSS